MSAWHIRRLWSPVEGISVLFSHFQLSIFNCYSPFWTIWTPCLHGISGDFGDPLRVSLFCFLNFPLSIFHFQFSIVIPHFGHSGHHVCMAYPDTLETRRGYLCFVFSFSTFNFQFSIVSTIRRFVNQNGATPLKYGCNTDSQS